MSNKKLADRLAKVAIVLEANEFVRKGPPVAPPKDKGFLFRKVRLPEVKKLPVPEPNIHEVDLSVCPRCKQAPRTAKLRGENCKVGSYYEKNDVLYCPNCRMVLPRTY